MNLSYWLDKGDIQKVVVTKDALDGLLKIIERDLHDCQIQTLSLDRRFATAYGAALNLANYSIRKKGFRVSGKVGHHKITFDVAAKILGDHAAEFLDYFDLCRRKRNKVDYDLVDVVSESEVEELISTVRRFQETIFRLS